jgi:hypothetical protein
MDQAVKKYLNLVSTLRNKLNPQLTKVEGSYQQAIVISFKNNFKLFISPFAPRPPGRSNFTIQGMTVIQDENFKALEQILNNKKIEIKYEDGSKFLFHIIKAFSKSEVKKVKENYKNIHEFELKSLLNDTFNLELDPNLEFFLFGSDEFSPRYSQTNDFKVPKSGIKCRIEDRSAIVINHPSGRILDLDSRNNYVTQKYIYLGNIFHYKKCSKKDASLIRSNGVNKKTYFKIVLNKNINLKKEKKLSYNNVNGWEFTLKIDSQGIYSLYDKIGQIKISHPDLLIRLIAQSKSSR